MFGKKKETPKLPTYKPTQSFLKLSEIRDDILIMQDGTLRAFLTVSSTNFDLKNQEEQDSLIMSYQRFLNSLDFPIQILMQSRKMDISKYLEKMKGLVEKQTNELLRIQTIEYTEFIDRLVETANIMSKNFYVIIPYEYSINPATPGFFKRLFKNTEQSQISDKAANFEKNKSSLDERVNTTMNGLTSLGMRVERLETGKIIELLYNSYNFESGPIINAGTLGDVALERAEINK
jgi:hypothetical protein